MKYDLFLSLGSNKEPRDLFLKKAVLLLNDCFEFVRISSVYSTNPLYDTDQNNFHNLCAYYRTDIDDAFEILEISQVIENKIGRNKEKNRPKGPRNIDIDIIMYSDLKINSDNLNIPHIGLYERNFVLIPLLEIFPEDLSEKYELKKHIDKNKGQYVEKIGELVL